MTQPGTLRVEIRALAAYGTERYEDAVTCGAIRRFLDHVGAVPVGAWGTLPDVSAKLARDWRTALDRRIDEALAARDEMDRLADVLLQIGADIQGTDIVNATSFDVVNQDLGPYLAAVDGYHTRVRARPGGAGIAGVPHNRHEPYERPAVVIPPENTRLAVVGNEVLPSTRVVEEPLSLGTGTGDDLTVAGGRTTYYDNGGGDALDQFVQRYRGNLLLLEAMLVEIGTDQRMPLSDLMMNAWSSSPEVIRNRADLLHSVANTYQAVRADMEEETKNLARYWNGVSADAFTQHAQSRSTWIGQLQAQASWLAEEGKKAATMLEGLRNAYAVAGYERIDSLLEAMQDYATRVRGLFTPCSRAEDKLADVADAFINFLVESEKRAIGELAELIKIDEQERKERPDLGTRSHDAVRPPAPAVGVTVWTDRAGWSPNPERPAV
ncbi:hypothetical protein [Actinoplanes teichomyceticus]|uniref:Uncharacterized protein n=1 Tax=Actinoplanes teichomyceticus TaxID=1867 RepID=A0A561WID3_ACTTI|nr:hypothetical protein [Actinoplanes teichomyceticus]TWG23614.1 hypothetical protein FHX34_102163 [Actinoplanes teichomyceticus]GIF11653.1 hypothetical protein Ate01nite_16850 [Actinoplanes teichomyceticus]